MTIWQIICHPFRAMALIGRLQGYEATALELNNVLDWLETGPGVKKVEGGWVVRHYPLNVQPVWKTLREAIRYGMEAE
jgi:hypothetical protein